MQISVFGLGYVGAVAAGCLSSQGHHVIGVDRQATKVDLVNAGRSPVIEKDIGEIIRDSVACGRLRATSNVADAIAGSELSLVCVGTPSKGNGNLDLSYVKGVAAQIGEALREKAEFHVIAMRSTMLPGSMRNTVIPIIEAASGKRAGVDFSICFHPEFLREGSAVYDYHNPPKTVIGTTDRRGGERVASLYSEVSAPLVLTDIDTAEMVKYSDNAWHALKVSFANEIGNICKAIGVDGHEVMDIFCQDTKLNLSPYYLKPGFAFGGSCLPKDLRALNHMAKSLDLEVPVINAILSSNRAQLERGIEMITSMGRKRIGVLGFSFKAGTDDLRESPMVEVIERLIGKGYDIRLYDRNVNVASLVGANRDYLINHIPHICRLMVGSIDKILAHAEVLVIGNADPEFRDIASRLDHDQAIVDFVRAIPDDAQGSSYAGICW